MRPHGEYFACGRFYLSRLARGAYSAISVLAYNGRVMNMKKILFKSMSTALRAADVLKSHGIVSRPVRGGSAKCGCCIVLTVNGSIAEAERILDAHAIRFEMSE